MVNNLTEQVCKILQKKHGLKLHENYINDPDGIFIKTIQAVQELYQTKLKPTSYIKVKTANNITGIIYLWKGFIKGKAPVHLQIGENNYSHTPEYLDPDELTFIEIH